MTVPPREPEPWPPWYRTAPPLVAAGALTAIVLAVLVFAAVKFATASSTPTAATSAPPPTDTNTSTVTQTVTVSPMRPFFPHFGVQ
jgi:hypothetical protein